MSWFALETCEFNSHGCRGVSWTVTFNNRSIWCGFFCLFYRSCFVLPVWIPLRYVNDDGHKNMSSLSQLLGEIRLQQHRVTTSNVFTLERPVSVRMGCFHVFNSTFMTLRMKWKSVMGCISHNGVSTMFTSSKLLPTAVCFPKLPGLLSCLGEWKRAAERRWRAGFETRDRTVWVEVQKKNKKLGIQNGWEIVCACLRTELKQEAEQEMERGRTWTEQICQIDTSSRGDVFIYISLSVPL